MVNRCQTNGLLVQRERRRLRTPEMRAQFLATFSTFYILTSTFCSVLGVWRIAHDPAKVGGQVRFLTRILLFSAACFCTESDLGLYGFLCVARVRSDLA